MNKFQLKSGKHSLVEKSHYFYLYMGEDNAVGQIQCDNVLLKLSLKYPPNHPDFKGLVGSGYQYKIERGKLMKKGEKDGYPIKFIL